jgi:hypothetical protein
VTLFDTLDTDDNGQAQAFSYLTPFGYPVLISFGDVLMTVSDRGGVYYRTSRAGSVTLAMHSDTLAGPMFHGMARLGNYAVVSEGDSTQTRLHFVSITDSAEISIDGFFEFGPVITDINADGAPDAVLLSRDGMMAAFQIDTTNNSDAAFHHLFTRETGLTFDSPPSVAIDGDGFPMILVGGFGKLYALDHNGYVVSDFPVKTDDRYPDAEVFLAPVTGDIAGDDGQEIVFSTFAGSVYAHGSDPVPGFPLNGGEFSSGSCVVFGDSIGGKVAYIGADGWLYCWDTDKNDNDAVWPMFGHDPAGTHALFDLPIPTPPQGTVADKSFFSYPNPVTSGQTTIRYKLGFVTSARIGIYDLSGEEVFTMDAPHQEGVNEFVWNCRGITPGVYRCVLEATGFEGTTKRVFTDIAVIR